MLPGGQLSQANTKEAGFRGVDTIAVGVAWVGVGVVRGILQTDRALSSRFTLIAEKGGKIVGTTSGTTVVGEGQRLRQRYRR